MRKYNVEKFGVPTWQRLVEVVGHSAGGANMALARKIAGRHMAASEANIAVAGEKNRKHKVTDEADKALAGKIASRHKHGGMSTDNAYVTVNIICCYHLITY